jgi:hypothetical protein
MSALPLETVRARTRAKYQAFLAQQPGAAKLDLALPDLYEAQQRIKSEAKRFNVLDIGRRAGKTYMGTHLALEAVRDGEPVGWFAPNYKYLLEVWQFLARELKPHASKINATERRIELTNGGLIECWTMDGSDDPGRSRKYKLAIVDEAAIASNLKAVWEEAIRATLTDLQGSAWFLSTPKGLNYFYELFQRGQDSAAFPDWKSWQMPSGVNPYLPPSEIEAARVELPEQAFQQEYLAKFLSGDGAVFRNVDACLTAPEAVPDEHKGHLLVAGVDWARLHDFTVISIVCCHCRTEVALDRFNQIGWALQRGRLLSLLNHWGVSFALIESNSIGAPNLEALHEHLPQGCHAKGFETTAKSKPKLIQGLVLAFERAKLQWLADSNARHELIAYEATLTESGYTKYGAPEGQWDDTVIARALAWKAADARIPVGLSENAQIDAELPQGWRIAEAPPVGTWQHDGWAMGREWKRAQIVEERKKKNPDLDNPWLAASPFQNTPDDPFGRN